MVTLKSGKVYLGVLMQYSNDADETIRSLLISPVFSGYRDKEKFSVTLNVDYKEPLDNGQIFEILIPLSEISSIARHDANLHSFFKSQGNLVFELIPTNERNLAFWRSHFKVDPFV